MGGHGGGWNSSLCDWTARYLSRKTPQAIRDGQRRPGGSWPIRARTKKPALSMVSGLSRDQDQHAVAAPTARLGIADPPGRLAPASGPGNAPQFVNAHVPIWRSCHLALLTGQVLRREMAFWANPACWVVESWRAGL
jgi:hypothetical protein